MKLYSLILAAVLSATLLPRQSAAQPEDSTSAAKIPVARRLYEEGVEAVGQGRWSIAHDRFKASYELSPRVLTLFNLAGSQLQTSRFVEASESYRRFLRETADGRYPDLRTDATSSLESIEKQVSLLTLAATNLDRADVLTIDGIVFPQSSMGEPIPMNPGGHTLAVTRGGAVIVSKAIELAPGVAQTATLDVPKKANLRIQSVDGPPADGLASGATRKDDDEGKSGGVLRSPWFWTVVVAVVAGGVTGAYFLTRPDDNTLVVH